MMGFDACSQSDNIARNTSEDCCLKSRTIPDHLRTAKLSDLFDYMFMHNFSFGIHKKSGASEPSSKNGWPTGKGSRAYHLRMSPNTYKKLERNDPSLSDSKMRWAALFLLKELEDSPELHAQWMALIEDRYAALSSGDDGDVASLLERRPDQSPVNTRPKSDDTKKRKPILWTTGLVATVVFIAFALLVLRQPTGFAGGDGGGDGGCCDTSGFGGGDGGSGGGSEGDCCGGPENPSAIGFGDGGGDDGGTRVSLLFLEGAKHGTFHLINAEEHPIQMTQAIIIWCRKDVLEEHQGCWEVPDDHNYNERRFTPVDAQLTYVEPGENKFFDSTHTVIEDIAWKSEEVISEDHYIWRNAMAHAIMDHGDEHRCHTTFFYTLYYESDHPQQLQSGVKNLDCALVKSFAHTVLAD